MRFASWEVKCRAVGLKKWVIYLKSDSSCFTYSSCNEYSLFVRSESWSRLKKSYRFEIKNTNLITNLCLEDCSGRALRSLTRSSTTFNIPESGYARMRGYEKKNSEVFKIAYPSLVCSRWLHFDRSRKVVLLDLWGMGRLSLECILHFELTFLIINYTLIIHVLHD